ncbi:TetR/AcrR family transcriptional regulator [Enhygromyxa salina]|uniref:Bacterial regulatory protein, tetR family n=1 Tax=Enhygromyxa salina TaxID=215803 RepID=A0A2S9YYN3_9BACT|nr:TetR/AcrR family transcriptional regulator [Enhygromyxa salina]PRQ10196.1 Bacterial regulatory protein, tetR family [Enhygromyxa salina]
MQPTVTAALTRALFEEWAARGYAAISLERVAKTAGVGKAALYRRWSSKLAMVSECSEQLGIELATIPDTGTLEGDVRKLLGGLRRLLRHPIVSRILPDLHAEMPRNPELAQAIRGRLQTERRRRAATIVERGIARGELDERVDPELVNDILGGVIYWRMIVTGGQADSRYLDRLTRFVVAGIREQVSRE